MVFPYRHDAVQATSGKPTAFPCEALRPETAAALVRDRHGRRARTACVGFMLFAGGANGTPAGLALAEGQQTVFPDHGRSAVVFHCDASRASSTFTVYAAHLPDPDSSGLATGEIGRAH